MIKYMWKHMKQWYKLELWNIMHSRITFQYDVAR